VIPCNISLTASDYKFYFLGGFTNQKYSMLLISDVCCSPIQQKRIFLARTWSDV